MEATTHRHLDAETLAKLANLQLRVQAVVDGTLTGLHRTPHHGSSVEFAEHKEYSPGDEIRHIDWKVYARFDRYYVRQYEDEAELKAYLLLDCSGSMGYGEPLSKLEYGSTLVASLAYLLARQGDEPGLVAFSDGVQRYVPPRSRSGHLAEVLSVLEALRPEGPTAMGRALTELTDRAARRSLVVLVSDLLDVPEEDLRLLRHLRARRHQVVLFHLLHDDEIEFPFAELAFFEAMEGSGHLLVDPASIRRGYVRQIARFLQRTEEVCREAEIVYERVTSSNPLDAVLLRALRRERGPR